jgi:predicted sulfurtransferase
MRYILSLLMISALALFLGCQNASSSTEVKNEKPADVAKTEKPAEKAEVEKEQVSDDGHDHTDDEAKRISLADAKKDFDNGNAVFVDTRSEVAYKNEHIKDSINVPAGNFEQFYKSIPKDKKIITYCS